MAESNLTLTYQDLMTEVAYEMGYGRNFLDPTSSAEGRQCDSIVQRAYRAFLVPSTTPMGMTYQWSFLRAIASFNTVIGTAFYDLPDNWGAPIGEPFMTTGEYNRPVAIQNVETSRLDYHLTNFPNTGPAQPRIMSIVPKAFSPTTGQRWQVGFWPTPDAVYQLQWRYHVLPNKLSATAPYHLGGMKHSQTLLAGCLAVCESVKHESQGEKKAEYNERLLASIAMDRLDSSVDLVGTLDDWIYKNQVGKRSETISLNFGGA